MKTYRVTSELAGFTRKRMLLRIFLAAGVFAALGILLMGPRSSSAYLLGDFIEAVVSGVVFGLLFVLVYVKRSLTYEVIVSADRITTAHAWFGRSIRKDELKSVWETRGNIFTAPALRISKHGRFGTWLWGGIWVPKALPGYEGIRDVALEWKAR